MALSQIKNYKMSPQAIYISISSLREAGVYMTAAMFGLYLDSLGIPYYLIPMTQVVFVTVIVLAELPTGMLADSRGRGWSIRMGSAFFTVGMLAYACSQGFWSAIASEALIAIGFAFISGAERAWITDAIKSKIKNPDVQDASLKKIFATNVSCGASASVLAGLVGALLAVWDFRITWYFGAILGCLSLVIAIWQVNGQGEPKERISEWSALKKSLNKLRKSKNLQWVIVLVMVSRFGAIFFPFWSIYFKDQLGGQIGLGIGWIPIYAAMGFGAYLIRRGSAYACLKNNEIHIIALAVGLMGFGLCFAGSTPIIMTAFAGIVILEMGLGMYRPLAEAYVEHRVKSEYRATFGSLESLFGRGAALFVQLIAFGITYNKPSTAATVADLWTKIGAVLVILTFIIWLFRPRKV